MFKLKRHYHIGCSSLGARTDRARVEGASSNSSGYMMTLGPHNTNVSITNSSMLLSSMTGGSKTVTEELKDNFPA